MKLLATLIKSTIPPVIEAANKELPLKIPVPVILPPAGAEGKGNGNLAPETKTISPLLAVKLVLFRLRLPLAPIVIFALVVDMLVPIAEVKLLPAKTVKS